MNKVVYRLISIIVSLSLMQGVYLSASAMSGSDVNAKLYTGIMAFPAFPGSVGFGSGTVGGRSGIIYKVTNLNDSGAGSLRDAVSKTGARIVIFDISGTIQLTSHIKIDNPFITILGQTSPNGIQLKGAGIKIRTHDVVVRGLMIRPGDESTGAPLEDRSGLIVQNDKDNTQPYNIVLDHNSIEWGVDESANIWLPSHDITWSNNIFAEGLGHAGHPDGFHSMGLLIGTGAKNITVYSNLFSNNNWRNPIMQSNTSTEVINNFVYAWGGGSIIVQGTGEGANFTNILGNSSKSSPCSTSKTVLIDSADAGSKVYLDDWVNVTGSATIINRIKSLSPAFDGSGIVPMTTAQAYQNIMSYAGARNDAVDLRVKGNVQNGTLPNNKCIIDSQSEVGGWAVINNAAHVDSDNDGLPDSFEQIYGVNLSPSDYAPSGYMWIEEYANGFYDTTNVPPTVISGNTGVAGEAVNYTGGSTTTDGSGSYSITVLSGWTGTVTPSSLCYTYTPPSRSYTNISSDQVAQNYVPSALDPTCAIANVDIGGVSRGAYLMQPNTSMVQKYVLDGGPVEIQSSNGTKFMASLNQWRRPSPSGGWTGVAQSRALPVGQISNSYVIPQYNGTDPTLYNAVLMANVDTVPRTITVTIGGAQMGVYTLAPSGSRFEVYNVTGGPVVVSSDPGSKIVASLYELKRAGDSGEYNGQSEMMGLPASQLSDKYLIPIYFGNWPSLLDASLAFANVDTMATTVEVKIAGVSRGTYVMQPSTSMVVRYTLDGGPVEISSNNGAKLVASLNQWRRPTPSGGWTGVTQSMALPLGQISNSYVIPRYNGTDPALYNAVLMANVDTVPRTITVKIGGTQMGTYTLAPSDSRFEVYNVVGGPIVVSSDPGSKIVASLYELKRAGATGEYNDQSEMMGLPSSQLSDKYLIPIYFGNWPSLLDASLYIGVP